MPGSMNSHGRLTRSPSILLPNGSVNGPIRQQLWNGQTVLTFPMPLTLSDGYDTPKRPVDRICWRLNRGECSDLHILPDTRTVVVTRMNIQSPAEVYSVQNRQPDFVNRTSSSSEGIRYGNYPLMGFKNSQITHLNDALLAQLDLPTLESFVFLANDKTCFRRFSASGRRGRCEEEVSGEVFDSRGPQGAWGDDWNYRWNAELFAANGYVVIMINMRGSTGYGQAIVDGVNGDWGGKPFTDLMEGLDYAEQHYPFY